MEDGIRGACGLGVSALLGCLLYFYLVVYTGQGQRAAFVPAPAGGELGALLGVSPFALWVFELLTPSPRGKRGRGDRCAGCAVLPLLPRGLHVLVYVCLGSPAWALAPLLRLGVFARCVARAWVAGPPGLGAATAEVSAWAPFTRGVITRWFPPSVLGVVPHVRLARAVACGSARRL